MKKNIIGIGIIFLLIVSLFAPNICGNIRNKYNLLEVNNNYKINNFDRSHWSAAEVVSTESKSRSFIPSIVVDSDGTIHVAWDDQTNKRK
jgi:hypothetical protein